MSTPRPDWSVRLDRTYDRCLTALYVTGLVTVVCFLGAIVHVAGQQRFDERIGYYASLYISTPSAKAALRSVCADPPAKVCYPILIEGDRRELSTYWDRICWQDRAGSPVKCTSMRALLALIDETAQSR